jgi:ubiquinol-cytochrome c reductase cytochrome c1 subunit
VSLQRGAHHFVNYCLSCHGAAYMRYSRLTDLGLTPDEIKKSLLFATDKVGDTMASAMTVKDGKEWFGAAPPDLSVIARVKGADYLYAYLRTFYRDATRPSGWNNLAFPNVGMPHVLYRLQGEQRLQATEKAQSGTHEDQAHEEKTLVMAKPGALSERDYDQFVADLVNYLDYMAEPAKLERVRLGALVLFFLALLFVLALAMKKAYWKDVK